MTTSDLTTIHRDEVPVRRPASMTDLPLTAAQQRLWFLDRFQPGWPSHDEMVYRLRGPLDPELLEEALNLVLRRHEAVWARFAERDGEPVQIMDGPDRLNISVVPLDDLPPAEREERLRSLVGTERVAPFDLTRGPLVRVTLIRLGPGDHVLCMVMHHIITDGISWTIALRHLRAEYEAVRDARPLRRPPAALDFGDYVVWQHSRRPALDEHLNYWQRQLANPPVLDLITDLPRPAERAPLGATVHRRIATDLAEAVEQLARACRSTPFMVLLAAYQVLLTQHSGQDDICVGTPTAGRPRPEFESIVGLFMNILVLRGDLSGAPTFRELVVRTRKRTLEALSRQEIPYESIVKALDLPRDTGRTPLFQTMFTLHTQENATEDLLPGVVAEQFDGGDTYAVFDLVLDIWRDPDGLLMMVRFDPALFTDLTAGMFLRQFETLLRSVVADPDLRLPDLGLDGADAQTDLLALSRPAEAATAQTTQTTQTAQTVLARFEEQATSQPDAAAVSCAGTVLSYGDLDRAANRLARLLRQRGVRAESMVAVCLPRDVDLIVTLVAVWKAGGCYLPLDPSHPPARLATVLADSGATHLVTLTGLLDRIVHIDRTVCLDRDGDAIGAQSDGHPDWRPATMGAAAYVIYTSGSTGRPKGVVVPQSAVAARVRWMGEHYAITPADRVLQFATVSFDTHVEEVYPCLAGGAELVLLPGQEQLPDFLASPHAAGLTILDIPTPYWHELVAHCGEIPWPSSLRLVIIGADQARPDAVAAWRGRFGDRVTLINTYGPTEATVIATAATLRGEDTMRRPPIGRPIAETSGYVLDERLRLAPVGVPGELYLGGAGLARGYLGGAAATADRFIPDPYGPPGGRLYRTGDRARWRSDLQLEFLGRVDTQAKVRGYRVEPAEIEARLLEVPGVGQAVVVARPTDSETTLVAYVVPDRVGVPASAELRHHLADSLPEYMLPSRFVFLDRIALTSNGKVDLDALSAAELPGAEPIDPALVVAPQTEAEELVAAVWREVLSLDQIGRTDDFFAIGGHSLLAIKVASRLGAVIGAQVPIRMLFRHRTLTALAQAIEELLVAALADLSDAQAEQLLAAAGDAPLRGAM